MDEDDIFMTGLIIGVVIILLLLSFDVFNSNTKELGQSICDQEYDMDFEKYNDGELTCKPKEIKEEVQYDGITIQIKDGGI